MITLFNKVLFTASSSMCLPSCAFFVKWLYRPCYFYSRLETVCHLTKTTIETAFVDLANNKPISNRISHKSYIPYRSHKSNRLPIRFPPFLFFTRLHFCRFLLRNFSPTLNLSKTPFNFVYSYFNSLKLGSIKSRMSIAPGRLGSCRSFLKDFRTNWGNNHRCSFSRFDPRIA